MSKLRLTLDDLCVESFIPEAGPAGPRGTVRANLQAVSGYCYQTLRCLSDFCESRDAVACYSFNPDWGTCQAVYTCPECASPPVDTDPSNCPAEIA